MSQSVYKSRKTTRINDKSSGKCGEITFCMQVGTRVYALNCLFCPQICIQWEAFINHIEQAHDGELRSDNLLQQEIEDVNIDTNKSRETAQKQPSAAMVQEAPQYSRFRVRNEVCERSLDYGLLFKLYLTYFECHLQYNDSTTSTEALSDPYDPLMVNKADTIPKTEPYDAFEIRIVNEAKIDQTCDSIDDQVFIHSN